MYIISPYFEKTKQKAAKTYYLHAIARTRTRPKKCESKAPPSTTTSKEKWKFLASIWNQDRSHIRNRVMQFVCRRSLISRISQHLYVHRSGSLTLLMRYSGFSFFPDDIRPFLLLLSAECGVCVRVRVLLFSFDMSVALWMNRRSALKIRSEHQTVSGKWFSYDIMYTLTNISEDNRRHPCTTL